MYELIQITLYDTDLPKVFRHLDGSFINLGREATRFYKEQGILCEYKGNIQNVLPDNTEYRASIYEHISTRGKSLRIPSDIIMIIEGCKKQFNTVLLNVSFMHRYRENVESILKDLKNAFPDVVQVDAAKPEKPKHKGRYRLTREDIKKRKEIVKDANERKKNNPRKTWKEIASEMDIPERTLRDYRHNPLNQ